MNKSLYIAAADAFRMYGDHSYLSGWNNVTNNRDWCIGTDFNNAKRLVLQNENWKEYI